MSSNELLEVHDLIQQQAAVIEKQNSVIQKLLQVIGQHAAINELSN